LIWLYANGVTPLIVAADIGMIEIVSDLVAKGANINAEIKGMESCSIRYAPLAYCCG
jgi:hypothetical protein